MGELLKKAKIPVILVICGLLLLPLLLKSSSMEDQKATWLWDTALIEDPGKIIAFCKEQNVGTIFLQVQKKVSDEDYRRFIAAAYEEGIAVHALDGQPNWAYEDQRREADQFLQWVFDYNAKAAPSEKFAGIQLDVEPYQLRRWARDQDGVVREWSSNVEKWVAQGKENGLYMSAAVPFWLGNVKDANGSGNLSRWMISQFDAVAVMSYRDSGRKIYDVAREQLDEADQLGKSVWIGMELGDTEEGSHITFFGKAVPVMEEEMKQVNSLGDSHPSFAGLAVHHYEIWQDKIASAASDEKPTKSNQ
ncbi:hypothetical protein P4H83_15730 [Paenibacillus favisporus]|uniref:hypothetical protein n=1 Tax=Paenibacillus TaxID=44249 RepID=UPI0011AB3F0A|nr:MULTISPECIES: hypothetical protein [Paenibacillus]MEC0176319.1 hypothetical protein [Paenibacillus favisporus]